MKPDLARAEGVGSSSHPYWQGVLGMNKEADKEGLHSSEVKTKYLPAPQVTTQGTFKRKLKIPPPTALPIVEASLRSSFIRQKICKPLFLWPEQSYLNHGDYAKASHLTRLKASTHFSNQTISNGWKLELKQFNANHCGNFFTLDSLLLEQTAS